MIGMLLSFFLSKIGVIAGPVVLLALAGYLAFIRLEKLAWPLVVAAGIWFASGTVFQEGVAACEARVARLVERQRQDIAKLSAEMTVKIDAAEADRAKAEDDLINVAVKYAANPARASCLNTEEDLNAIDGP